MHVGGLLASLEGCHRWCSSGLDQACLVARERWEGGVKKIASSIVTRVKRISTMRNGSVSRRGSHWVANGGCLQLRHAGER